MHVQEKIHINLGDLRLTEMTFSDEPAVKGDGLRGESTKIIESYLQPGEENYQSHASANVATFDENYMS